MPAPPHVVIIGGGFAGLYAARTLARSDVRVTLIDARNHHLFQPLLYQVATAGLSGEHIASPLRRRLATRPNVRVLLDRVTEIDRSSRRVIGERETVHYDYLLVAVGAVNNYYGREDWAKHAPGLKSIEDALAIRRRILLAFEEAERETDPDRVKELLTFVVIGGGPTGVELAGAIREVAAQTMARDFRSFRPQDARVVLVEGGDRVLATYSRRLSKKAETQLRTLEVEVRTGAAVEDVDETGVVIAGERLRARTVLWAAGVKANPLVQTLGAPLTRDGRVKVEDDLTLPGDGRVFVAGDVMAKPFGEGWVPGVAPAAIQSGAFAARNILRAARGKATRPFRYWDKGSLATIGRRRAVGAVGPLEIWGTPAWVAWLGVHLFYLAGFRNQLAVLMEWAWAYFTYQRGSRVILGDAPADTTRAPERAEAAAG